MVLTGKTELKSELFQYYTNKNVWYILEICDLYISL